MNFRQFFKVQLFCLLSIAWFSCKDEGPAEPAVCCGIPAINEDIGNGHIFIPNIFTPNGDGINDRFFFGGDSIKLIRELEIVSEENETVFTSANLPLSDNNLYWDGEINGDVRRGVYSFTIVVEALNGIVKTFDGHVCNFPCGEDFPDDPIDGSNCKFPAQNDDGYYCNTCPSGESNDCYLP